MSIKFFRRKKDSRDLPTMKLVFRYGGYGGYLGSDTLLIDLIDRNDPRRWIQLVVSRDAWNEKCQFMDGHATNKGDSK